MNTITGISFYDALTKLTIGFLLTWWWPQSIIDDMNLKNSFHEINYSLYIIACFIIGCLWQSLAIILPCRCNMKIFKLKRLIRIITHCIPYGKSNYTPWIRLKYRHIYNNHKKNNIMHQYLKAYYNTQKKGLMGNIPKIEALEAFLRYAFIPFLGNVIYIFWNIIMNTSYCWSILILFLLIFLYLRLWQYYNQKIYELVWEADKYLKEIEKEKDNNFPNDINIISI